MDLSRRGLELIEQFEGYSLAAYQDSVGVWTIGYGHTDNVQRGDEITQQQAFDLLRQDTQSAADAVNKNVTVPLNQNQFDALVSLTYNIGAHGYPGLLSTLNTGRYGDAASWFPVYCHAGGHVVPGLVTRRAAERKLFEQRVESGVTTC